MVASNHEVVITARKKEVTYDLLDAYNIPYTERGAGKNSMVGKLTYLPKANYILYKTAKKFKPDVFLSFSSPYAAQVSKLFGKPHIALDDTEHASLGRLMYRPFTDTVLSPKCFKGKISKKQVLFNGYLELCYLHPNYFTPDESILDLLNVNIGEQFSLLRFVSWRATHDAGHKGLTDQKKRLAVQEFSQYGKVFISSEADLPEDLQQYKINIPPHRMHDAINYASLLWGESATMASEAAVLGVPAVYLDNDGRGYTDELEKEYGLVFNYTESSEDQTKAIEKGAELLKNPNSKEIFIKKRNRMLEEKVDVLSFIIDYVMSFKK